MDSRSRVRVVMAAALTAVSVAASGCVAPRLSPEGAKVRWSLEEPTDCRYRGIVRVGRIGFPSHEVLDIDLANEVAARGGDLAVVDRVVREGGHLQKSAIAYRCD